uniref:Replication protein n=2 Tax=Escherichia coli TaxID=562 RepID=A0A5B9SXF6_ECOLX|nr:replication protein [Escherichia coli]
MERNMALLKAKGAHLTLSTCGDKGEACVAIAESKGTYTSRDKKHTYAIVE